MSDDVDAMFAARQRIIDEHKYVEIWHHCPFEDYRDVWWGVMRDGNIVYGHEAVRVAAAVNDSEALYTYGDELYEMMPYAPEPGGHVFRGPTYTLLRVDTQCDLNRIVMIVRNDMELRVCDDCNGEGEIVRHKHHKVLKCRPCGGQGVIRPTKPSKE